MNTFESAFLSLHASLPEAHVQAEYKNAVLSRALSIGIDRQHEETDEGNYAQADGSIRYLESDEPSAWGGKQIIGRVIIINSNGKQSRCRVVSRLVSGGVVSLNLIDEHGER